MNQVRIQLAAVIDLTIATAWYEEKREGLGLEFVLEFDAAIERIARFPRSYEIQYREARRILLRRFPYSVYFTFGGNVAEVFAVLHQHDNPLEWQSRS